jgi:DNA-binding protein H-NS
MTMTDYHKKLTTIQKQRQKLIETETLLIEKRKKDIAELAEQFNLLTVDDKTLSNLFSKLKELPHESSEKTSHDPREPSSSHSEICEVENAGT